MKDKSVILVVDDQPKNTELLEAHLVPKGYEVVSAASGEEALKMLSGNQIDLVLLDVMMPRMSGFEVLEKIRADKKTQLIPVVMVTVLKETEDRVKALEAGCDDFISKPFDRHELLARVKSLLRIKSLHEIEKAREYAENIINTVRESLISLDQDLRVVTVSRSFYDFFKVKPEETVGQLIYDLGNKQWDIPKLRELLENILPEKTAFDGYEVEHNFATIGRRVMLLNARQIEQAMSKKRIILLAIEDITERKEIENGLKKSHEELKALTIELERTAQEKNKRTEQLNQALENAEEISDRMDAILTSVSDGLVVTNYSGNVVLMNPAAEILLGLRFSECKGKPLYFDIENQALKDRIRVALEEREHGCQFDFETPGDQPGRPRILRAKTAKISKVEAELKDRNKMVIIISDVTFEREVDRMKTEFLSTAAHELRTPLTSIQGFSEILLTRDNLDHEKQQKYLSYIDSKAKSLAKTINDLLDISRIESGKGLSLQIESFDLGKSMKELVEVFRSRAPDRNFEIDIPEEPLMIFGDQEKLSQVMENLLSNSLKYSAADGKIRITIQKSEEFERENAEKSTSQPSTILIRIDDEGLGMAPDQVKRIFDKFWRADASNNAIEGTGLGMSIVKDIVESHGGTVRVESEPGKGTTVTIEMPGDLAG